MSTVPECYEKLNVAAGYVIDEKYLHAETDVFQKNNLLCFAPRVQNRLSQDIRRITVHHRKRQWEILTCIH